VNRDEGFRVMASVFCAAKLTVHLEFGPPVLNEGIGEDRLALEVHHRPDGVKEINVSQAGVTGYGSPADPVQTPGVASSMRCRSGSLK